MKADTEVVRLSKVSKTMGEKRVLDSVDWTVKSGENWVLLGLNGSGKTTLLRIASGHLWPTSGEVSILGSKLGSVDLRALRRRIGWVSSALTSRMPPGMAASDVVLSGRFDSVGLYDEPAATERRTAREVMGLMGCLEVADRPFGVLSQGEQQRVLIARALMPRPKLLVLDEPCVGLDLKAREAFLESVRALAKSDLTVVYVTHHLEEMMPEFTHVLLLKDGAAFRSGLKADVVTSENLSAAFKMDIAVEERAGRYYVRV
jgi:iron complex transport system ATP-binding protein